jgi:hypothetical protein
MTYASKSLGEIWQIAPDATAGLLACMNGIPQPPTQRYELLKLKISLFEKHLGENDVDYKKQFEPSPFSCVAPLIATAAQALRVSHAHTRKLLLLSFDVLLTIT